MSDPLSLYVHIPFCRRKCGYCDFYSVEDPGRVADFVDSLCREIRLRSGQAASTLYFGGGTPSLLGLDRVEQILSTIHESFRITRGAEITVEANPGTIGPDYLAGLKGLGINRLSLGTQSFDDGKLAFLGRVHQSADNIRAVKWAEQAGFDNLGLDLIYALPNESLEAWQQDMAAAVDLAPSHLSCYMLTVEPGTRLHRQYEAGRFTPAGPDRRTAFFLETSGLLEKRGYIHYEISNFAKGDENRSRHNGNYWRLTPYLGFGPAAHSFGHSEDGQPMRSWNAPDVKGYIRSLSSGNPPPGGHELLTAPQQLMEKIMLGLRTKEGIHKDLLSDRQRKPAQHLLDQSLARVDRGRLKLTKPGMARLDSILEAFAEVVL